MLHQEVVIEWKFFDCEVPLPRGVIVTPCVEGPLTVLLGIVAQLLIRGF